MSEWGFGLAGCGVVGSAVVRLFGDGGRSAGARLRAIAVRDDTKPRDADLVGIRVGTDALALARDPELAVVVEATGDVALGYALALDCFSRGKGFVTASKSLVARHGVELEERAAAAGTAFRYEAAAGGALPVVALLRLGLSPGPVHGFDAVLNGTCNFVLSELERGVPFLTALDSARAAGFAEADCGRDTSGRDTADKLVVLARLCGVNLPLRDVDTRGIEGLEPEDVAFGRRRGWALRLVARFRDKGGVATADVAPAFVPADSPLACARNEENAIVLDGGPAGPLALIGRGAGGEPTAAAILADLADVVERRTARRLPATRTVAPRRDDAPTCHYLRVSGVSAANVTAAFRAAGIPLQALVISGAGPLRVLTAAVPPSDLQLVVASLAGHVRAQVALRVPAAAADPAAFNHQNKSLVAGAFS